MNRPVIIGVGEIVWDCLPEKRTLGGAPVNFAYHAMRLGADSYPVSAVGKDNLGEETLDECRFHGLRTEYLQQNELPTSRVLVHLDAQGIPTYRILENVAWDALQATPEVLQLATRADTVCWGSLAQRSEPSRRSILQIVDAVPDCSLKVFDINLRQHYFDRTVIESSLLRANILKLNEDELPVVLQLMSLDGIPALVKQFSLRYLIYTRGASDSEVYGPEGLISHIDTPQVAVVDTVGAGDSFTAAFVTSILTRDRPQEAHASAVQLSARVCQAHGAMAL